MVAAFKQMFQPGVVLLMITPASVTDMSNVDGLGLKIEWDITRSRGSTSDQGVVKVYNLNPLTRGTIHEVWKTFDNLGVPSQLSVSLGWEFLITQVMLADIYNITPEERMGEDVVTTFFLGDGGVKVRDAVVGQSFANTSVKVLVEILVLQGLGVIPDPVSLTKIAEKAAQIPLQSWPNYLLYNDVEEAIDNILETVGLEWKILNGTFIVTDLGNAATASLDAFLLSAQTGLLEWTTDGDSGIQLSALSNPNVSAGSAISVIDSFGKPVGSPQHRVETIRFHGSSDGTSLMDIQGRKSTFLTSIVTPNPPLSF